METECTAGTLQFQAVARRAVQARFDGGALTSDGGAVLLREVDRVTGILPQFAACFRDTRDPARVTHPVRALVRQRVYGLALGYEDLSDHDQLRHDPLFAVLAEADDLTAPLADKSTLNRLELSAATVDEAERYKKIAGDHAAVDRLLVDVFLQAHAAPPTELVLDLDATDDPVHGAQEGRFFHGYYGHYCYLPLYIFAGEHLLCARLRPANIDASAGAVEEVARIVAHLRAATGAPARVFAERTYQTRASWSRARRVMAKAEHLAAGADGKSNPRFVVTSLLVATVDARTLYEDVYCARGEMENRIKEQQLMLFADRTSAATMRANQLRLNYSAIAYLLLHALRADPPGPGPSPPTAARAPRRRRLRRASARTARADASNDPHAPRTRRHRAPHAATAPNSPRHDPLFTTGETSGLEAKTRGVRWATACGVPHLICGARHTPCTPTSRCRSRRCAAEWM